MGASSSSLDDDYDAATASIENINKQIRDINSQITTLEDNVKNTVVLLDKCAVDQKKVQTTILSDQSTHKQAFDNLQITYNNLKKKLGTYQNSLDAARKEKLVIETRLNKLTGDLQSKKSTYNFYSSQITNLLDEQKELNERIATIKTQLVKSNKSVKDLKAVKSTHIQTLIGVNTNLKSDLKRLEAQLHNTNNSVATGESRVKGLKTDKGNLETQIKTLEETLSKTQKSTPTSQELAAIKSAIDGLKARVEQLNTHIAKNTLADAKKQKAVDALKAQQQALNNSIAKLKSLQEMLRSRVLSTNQKLSEDKAGFESKLQKDKSQNDKTRTEAKRLHDSLKKRVQDLTKELARLKKIEDTSLNPIISGLTNQLNKARNVTIPGLKTDITALKTSLQTQNGILTGLTSDLKTLKQNIETYISRSYTVHKGVKYAPANIISTVSRSHVRDCMTECLKTPQCHGFTKSASQCQMFKTTIPDGNTYSNDIVSYRKVALEVDDLARQIQILTPRLNKAVADLQQTLNQYHTRRPVVVDGNCTVAGMTVTGWFVRDNKCVQVCADGNQHRHGDGRCKCGNDDPNKYCRAGTRCTDRASGEDWGKCAGIVFGSPPLASPLQGVGVQSPGSIICPDNWKLVSTQSGSNIIDHCTANGSNLGKKIAYCERLTKGVKFNRYNFFGETRGNQPYDSNGKAKLVEYCGLKWSGIDPFLNDPKGVWAENGKLRLGTQLPGSLICPDHWAYGGTIGAHTVCVPNPKNPAKNNGCNTTSRFFITDLAGKKKWATNCKIKWSAAFTREEMKMERENDDEGDG